MQRSAWAGVSLAIVVALVAMGGWLLARQGDEAFANPGIVVGIDTDPYNTPANTASSLGTIQRCISKNVNDEFDIDLYIKDVTNLTGWDVWITHTESMVEVQNATIVGWFLGTPFAYEWGNATDVITGYAFNVGSPWYSGSGVLMRVTLKAMGNGLSPLNITLNSLSDKDGVDLIPQTTVSNGWVAVGQGCDVDSDGVPDNQDKCPETYHPANTDVDGDGVAGVQPPPGANWGGDACDDSDADGFTDRIELYVGTSYQIACPLTATANDEADDKWPLDMNDTKSVSSADILVYAGKVSPPTSVSNCPAGANCRLDLNASGVVSSADILLYTGKVSPPTSCT